MKTRFLMSVAAAASVLTGSAYAADMPLKARPAPPPPIVAPVCDWCGVYIGLNAGGVWGHKDIDLTTTGLFADDPNAVLIEHSGSSRLRHSGFIGGGQIGVNSQWHSWVVGLEGDIQWTDLKFSRTTGAIVGVKGAGGAVESFAFQEDEKDQWLATIRPRIGYAAGPVLIYATGGLAFGELNLHERFVASGLGGEFGFLCAPVSVTNPGCVGARGSSDRVGAGWTVGGGIEWRFAQNWSVKAEGLFVDLGRQSFDTVLLTPAVLTDKLCAPNCFAGSGTHVEAHLTEAIARVGINYRFWTAAPVVARY